MRPQPDLGPSADGSETIWKPTAEYLERSRLLRFMRLHGIESYADLHRRSVEDIAWFWEAVVRDELQLEWLKPYDRVLDLSDGPAWPHWFPGGKLNYSVNAVDRHAAGDLADRPAIRWEGEEGTIRTLSYAELQHEVCRLAAGLLRLGIRRGDRVGIFLPMLPETAIAALACSRIGAIYLPLFSGYGAEAVATRLRDSQAKLLITADGFYRRGRVIPMKGVADAAADQAPSVKRVLVVPRLGVETAWRDERDVRWQDVLGAGEAKVPPADTDADEPFLLIYTSGTTGQPKGTVHVHAGFPVRAAQDMAHSFDLHPGDTLFWITDMGWVMGPLSLTASLILGATALMYDGAPDYPDPGRIWAMVERHGVSHLGLSPTLVRGLMAQSDDWVRRHDRSSLRVLGSTGEPWTLDAWLWYFREVGGSALPVVNYSGGTECTGGILTCMTIEPIKACSFSGPAPGMDAVVLDDRGQPVEGQVGELAVRQPWVGMTQGFWGDPDRYLRTYWERVPDVWVHGDWALHDGDGFWYILGRSDDTLKIAGKRVGPAEVESAALSHPAVRDAVAVGIPHPVKGDALMVFVVLGDVDPDDGLRDEIRQTVGHELGKALLPDDVRFVGDLPRTRNGKLLRRLVRASYLDQEPGDVTALDNPDALRAVRESA